MFNLGVFMGMQVGDIVIAAIVSFVAILLVLATRNMSSDKLNELLGGKHGRD